jgi:hypothetical protein
LGERLLCKQEVVGSIPSGSTRRRCKSKLKIKKLVRENYQSATAGFLSGAGVMSDIVKRRSIRAFGATVKGREGRAISNQGSEVGNP